MPLRGLLAVLRLVPGDGLTVGGRGRPRHVQGGTRRLAELRARHRRRRRLRRLARGAGWRHHEGGCEQEGHCRAAAGRGKGSEGLENAPCRARPDRCATVVEKIHYFGACSRIRMIVGLLCSPRRRGHADIRPLFCKQEPGQKSGNAPNSLQHRSLDSSLSGVGSISPQWLDRPRSVAECNDRSANQRRCMVRKLFYCNGLRDNRKERLSRFATRVAFCDERRGDHPDPGRSGSPRVQGGAAGLGGGVPGNGERRPLRETSLSSGGRPQG